MIKDNHELSQAASIYAICRFGSGNYRSIFSGLFLGEIQLSRQIIDYGAGLITSPKRRSQAKVAWQLLARTLC